VPWVPLDAWQDVPLSEWGASNQWAFEYQERQFDICVGLGTGPIVEEAWRLAKERRLS